jgi:hypothetical protein
MGLFFESEKQDFAQGILDYLGITLFSEILAKMLQSEDTKWTII